MYGDYGWHGYGMGYGMGGLGWIFMVLVWLLLIAGIAAVIKWIFFSGGTAGHLPPPSRNSALQILEERYARGEIDRDEFLEKRRHLEEGR
ncbi:MAG TPA: SHOCT domain-containing protein [Gammaproteobacteria bacterium]|nr:SHOCT domain-containing protein [Gammaproteobacteria bacterium]